MDSKYFIRNTRYMMMKERLMLKERSRAGLVTMDEWYEVVFLGADGEHTVAEFIKALGNDYPDGVPEGLADQTRQIIGELEARGYIALSDEKKTLPYYLAIPIEQQDRERAKLLMEADGFISAPEK
jgi:hypothetical protein